MRNSSESSQWRSTFHRHSALRIPHSAFVIVLLALSCSSTTSAPSLLAPGLWGGDRVNLIVAWDSARVEMVCASGSLKTPITLDAKGRFDVPGTYRLEIGPVGQPVPARWFGTYDQPGGASRITLYGVVSSTNQADTIGPFHLVAGQRQQTLLCA